MHKKFVIGFLLAIPILNTLFYFIAEWKEGDGLSGDKIAAALVGLVFFLLLVAFVIDKSKIYRDKNK